MLVAKFAICENLYFKFRNFLHFKVLLENNCASATWEQLCQCLLRTFALVSLWNNRAILTWQQLSQCHLGIIGVPVPLGNNRANLT